MSLDPRKTASEKYRSEVELFGAAAEIIKQILIDGCKSAGVRVEVEVRAKSTMSFIKKINSKNYVDPWKETTDKVGGRIISETLLDLEKLAGMFEKGSQTSLVEVLDYDDKSDKADPKDLFYPGIHIQAVVPGAFTSDGERIECEIQLRTKAQDAWAVAGHGRIYKGITPVSKKTKRRLYRLSVLPEMFDEEVKTAMEEIRSEPGYEEAVLLQAAESLFIPMVGEPGEDSLSIEVFKLLRELFEKGKVEEYILELTAFVKSQSSKISRILEDFGPNSSFAGQWAYWLFSQPECLVIFEKVANCPIALSEIVKGTDMEEAFKHLYEAWGESLVSFED